MKNLKLFTLLLLSTLTLASCDSDELDTTDIINEASITVPILENINEKAFRMLDIVSEQSIDGYNNLKRRKGKTLNYSKDLVIKI